MAVFNDDMTLVPEIRSLESIIRNQKEAIRGAVEDHVNWDPLLRHDLIHHCLNQNMIPVRLSDENDTTFHSKMLLYRQKLDMEKRLGNCALMLIDALEKAEKTNNKK